MTIATLDAYGTAQAVTITLAALANSTTAGQEGTAIDNSTTRAIDWLVGGKITTGSTVTANNPIEIWWYGYYDTSKIAGGGTGSNAALTPVVKGLLRPMLIIPVTATANQTYAFGPFSINAIFGLPCPPIKFSPWVLNSSGGALHATAGNHEIICTPIKFASS
jgi:hypothetical protein